MGNSAFFLGYHLFDRDYLFTENITSEFIFFKIFYNKYFTKFIVNLFAKNSAL